MDEDERNGTLPAELPLPRLRSLSFQFRHLLPAVKLTSPMLFFLLAATLASLPPAPEPRVTQRLGWHSEYATSADKTEWVELNLGQAQQVDAVALIPPPPTGGTVGPGYGFPRRFYIELLSEGDDDERTILADFTEQDFPNPGLLPVFVRAEGAASGKQVPAKAA